MAARLQKLVAHVGVTQDVDDVKEADGVAVYSEACRSGPASTAAAAGSPMATIAAERAAPAFNVQAMTHLLDGGEAMTQCKEKALQQLMQCPEFATAYPADEDRVTHRRKVMERIRCMYRLFVSDHGDLMMRKARLEVAGQVDPAWFTKNGVHFGLFMGAVSGQGDDDQQAEWLPLILQCAIVGSYGMTELGHGSFVRGIETTATYVPETDEFDVHTPTLTATKWWLGAAGQTATHCAVFAQLMLNGKSEGVHCFMVQLRDLESFDAMPGVTLGDCGAKMGRHGIDNGWIQFNHVRIPRRNMLMRHSQLSRSGVLTKAPAPEVTYGALITGRAAIVKDSADTLQRALTIAVRYAAVRRQGEPMVPGAAEPQILDYGTMQYRLMPILATAYAFRFTGAYMVDLHEKFSFGDSAEQQSLLRDVHATSAGLKAFSTWYVLDAIEQCRQTCGGHGYSAYTGLSTLYGDFAVQCSWEGDNTVMALQTARYLMSDSLSSNASPFVQYLLPSRAQERKVLIKYQVDLLDLSVQQTLLQGIAAFMAKQCSSALAEAKTAGLDATAAWNRTSPLLLRLTKCHVYCTMAKIFTDAILKQQHAEATKPAARAAHLSVALKVLSDLFALKFINDEIGTALKAGILTPEQALLVDEAVLTLCAKARKSAVCYVDAFNMSDFVVRSPLGRYDGDIYRAYFETVKNAPNSQQKAPYLEEVVRPMLHGADLSRS